MGNEEDLWGAAWLRGGRISEVAWIGQDTLGWCSGLRLVFLDVPTNRLRLSELPSDVVAAGASCLSGHFGRAIFAYAERNPKPRIFVHMYPSMEKLCECVRETSYSYLATAFAGDFLVSLSSIPNFKLTLWSWRNGEKLTSIGTAIHDSEEYAQSLRVNFFTPTFIAQVGNTSGRLKTWELAICGRSVILSKNEIHLPNKALVKGVSWCPESEDTLAVVDRDGHVYLSNSEGTEIRRIVLSQRCGICLEHEPAVICWHRGGIVLRTTFCQIRYYCKDFKDLYKMVWYTKSKNYPLVLTSHPFANDRLFITTREGHIVQIKFADNLSDTQLDFKHFYGGKYSFFDFVHPWEDHIVAVDALTELSLIQAHDGVEITRVALEIKGNITSMLSHPDYPLVVISSTKGEIAFVSLLDFHNPKVLGIYRMQAESLDLMKFSSSGRFVQKLVRIICLGK